MQQIGVCLFIYLFIYFSLVGQLVHSFWLVLRSFVRSTFFYLFYEFLFVYFIQIHLFFARWLVGLFILVGRSFVRSFVRSFNVFYLFYEFLFVFFIQMQTANIILYDKKYDIESNLRYDIATFQLFQKNHRLGFNRKTRAYQSTELHCLYLIRFDYTHRLDRHNYNIFDINQACLKFQKN